MASANWRRAGWSRKGHRVVLHGRTAQRAAEAMAAVPGAESALAGDLSSMAQTRALADQVNAIGNVMGRFDAVIHNAGVGYRERQRNATEDGLPLVFAVNTLAPYLLTALIETPRRPGVPELGAASQRRCLAARSGMA